MRQVITIVVETEIPEKSTACLVENFLKHNYAEGRFVVTGKNETIRGAKGIRCEICHQTINGEICKMDEGSTLACEDCYNESVETDDVLMSDEEYNEKAEIIK